MKVSNLPPRTDELEIFLRLHPASPSVRLTKSVVVSETSLWIAVPVPDVAASQARFLVRSRQDGVEHWTGQTGDVSITASLHHSPPAVVFSDGDLWVVPHSEFPDRDFCPESDGGRFSSFRDLDEAESAGGSLIADAATDSSLLPDEAAFRGAADRPALTRNAAFSIPLRN